MKTVEINQLLSLNSKMNDKLNELLESVKYESCKYHLVGIDKSVRDEEIFCLYRIEDKKELCSGKRRNIESYIKLRSIDKAIVYNFKELENYQFEY
jgi:hypothetical protein